MRDLQRLEELEDAVLRLRRAAEGAVLLVEGKKDLEALEALGIGGDAQVVNRGMSLEVFMDRLVEDAAGRPVILLLDWDRTGGRLFRRLLDGLSARVPVDGEHRRRLAQAAHTKSLEEVPADLAALRRRVGGVQ